MNDNSWDMFRVSTFKCGPHRLKLQEVKGDGVAASWWIGHWRWWRHHRHAASCAAASGTGPESGSEPAVGEVLCREEQWVTSENVFHGWLHVLTVTVCVQSASSPLTGGKPVSKWTTWLSSSMFRRPSGPPEMFLWECTEASGGHKHTSMTKMNPILQWRRFKFWLKMCQISDLGWWVCTVTAFWRASPRGTWWWCTCCRASTSPLWPTCCSSTTAWRTPPSVCSTCCWLSAPWPPSTGKQQVGSTVSACACAKCSRCVLRVNLGNASVALRELITLDSVALAAFCESTFNQLLPKSDSLWSKLNWF